MGRLTATSNPTGIKEIDRKRANLSISDGLGGRTFMLDHLSLDGLDIPSDSLLIVVAKAGNTNIRHELGSVASYSKHALSLQGLDLSQPLRFRILIHKADDPKLIGSIENIRAHDESQSESLIPMEPAQLGERLWRLVINEDGPVLQFNSDVFPNASGAENFTPFGALVLPEALRQVMADIADDPARLSDDGDPMFVWANWLDSIGAEQPPDDVGEAAVKQEWCDRVVDRFCEKFLFAQRLKAELLKVAGND